MCGIAGFIGLGDRDILRRMTDAIRHRGPDAEGHWVHETSRVFLGQRRLSIVDLSGGTQPMWTADGAIVITFNGEIYNHEELRAELIAAGRTFQTDHSDTEVLLHGYAQWGDSFVERLNGMWAFVIYDRARRRIFASRDRFGKKPFYWFHEAGTFGFASELSALTQHPSCPRNISRLSLKKYFAYCYIPAPLSIYERVHKLPGGHNLSFDLPPAAELQSRADPEVGGSQSPRSMGVPPENYLPSQSSPHISLYWHFVLEPDPAMLHDPAASETLAACHHRFGAEHASVEDSLRRLLDRAVQRRLMSDVPLGVFLSGGIDSSAIAAFAAQHVSAGNLNTFSIGFNESSFDESSYARLVAKDLGTRHHEDILDLDKSVALLPDIVSRLDEPLGDGSLLPTYLLSKFTRQHVTVALGGDGGDELFAGYDPFRALQKAELYSRLIPRPVHAGIRHLAARLPVSHTNISWDFKVKRTLMGLSYDPRLWNGVWMSALEPSEIADLFAEPTDPEEIYSEAIEAWDRCAQPNLIDRALQFWTNLYLQDGIMAKVDRASMLCSLEARSPFLDIEFVDLARRIPWQLKLHKGETKWILKRALEPLLPREIVHRPKKGFGMPIGRWLRENRFPLNHTSPTPHLDTTFAQRKATAHMAGQSDERLFLWSYWVLEQWLRR
jgi:asparagine synthase (glutamine-hydrolysing)